MLLGLNPNRKREIADLRARAVLLGRLIAERQRCRVISSIEEMIVPPLPIATHQT